MTTVPQRIYRFNATSVKILMTFCTELQEAILKKKKKKKKQSTSLYGTTEGSE